MEDTRKYNSKLLAEWQSVHCKGCTFAEEKLVGTGKPCCTFHGPPRTDKDGKCLNRKEKE